MKQKKLYLVQYRLISWAAKDWLFARPAPKSAATPFFTATTAGALRKAFASLEEARTFMRACRRYAKNELAWDAAWRIIAANTDGIVEP